MRYNLVMVFKATVSLTEIKKFMQEFNMPYPVLKDGVEYKLTLNNIDHIPNEDEIKMMSEALKRAINDVDTTVHAEQVTFDGFKSVKPIED